jgi:histidinol-phosphate aminotransferase
MEDKTWKYAVSAVQELNPYLPGKPIEEVERELDLEVGKTLKLASNENPLGASPKAIAAIATMQPALELYPDGSAYRLKQKLADKLSSSKTLISPAQITLGNGSNDVIDLIARTFLTVGRDAIFSEYAFAVYKIVIQAAGAQAHIAKANPITHSSMPYGHDLSAMLRQIRGNTHVVFIANPNNPTGTWLHENELERFMRQVPKQVIVVIDEAYCEYVDEGIYPETLNWLKKYPNLIITRTFSKIYGLASLRIGYAISSPEIADLLNRVRQPFNVNSIALVAAEAALDDDEHVENSAKTNRQGLQQWHTFCEQLKLDYLPSVGNFLTIKLGKNAQEIYQALLQEGIIVRPIANYGLAEYLRFTMGTEAQNTRCIEALKKVINL